MDAKNAGIITFHNADNLGAVLQAYALEKVLKNECGVNAEIIDYRCDIIENGKRPQKADSIKKFLKNIPLHFYYKIKSSGFQKFRKKYLNLSESCDKKTVKEISEKYDLIITGSDQVFNLECSGDDYSYFLDFVSVNTKKLSYAASLGSFEFSEGNFEKAAELLKDFDKISVREASAVKKLEQLNVTDISVEPDPVLLLNCDEWKKIMPPKLFKEKYILVYLIQDDVNVLKTANEYAQKHNCKIISNKKSIEFILKNSPECFLSWIYNAECVFTNSFHATAFSLIFNKPLGADIELASFGVNNRVKELLVSCGAESCIITNSSKYSCDYNSKESLEKLKNKGLSYLKNICNL